MCRIAISLAILDWVDRYLCMGTDVTASGFEVENLGPVLHSSKYQTPCKTVHIYEHPVDMLPTLFLSLIIPVAFPGAARKGQSSRLRGRRRHRNSSTMFMEDEEENAAELVPAVLLRKLERKKVRLFLEPHGLEPIKERRRFHRFVKESDPTFKALSFSATSDYSYITPTEFQGVSNEGFYGGSYQVQFTLVGQDDKPKAVELLRSYQVDEPSFGAVRVRLPLGVSVNSFNSRMVVTRVKPGSQAQKAKIAAGDIIRGVSLPDERFAWTSKRRDIYISSEEGVLILDGRSKATWQFVLRENARAYGKRKAEVVLILERPLKGVSSKQLCLSLLDRSHRHLAKKRKLKRVPSQLEVLQSDKGMGSIGMLQETVKLGDSTRKVKEKINEALEHQKEQRMDARTTNTLLPIRTFPQNDLQKGKPEYDKRLRLVNKMLERVDGIISTEYRTPSFGELLTYIDETSSSEKQNKLYFFHLNSLVRVRQLHDLAYHTKVFNSQDELEEVEGFPSVDAMQCENGKLDGDLRLKGPDGEKFVAKIVDVTTPKSSYLQHINMKFEEDDLLTKLDDVVKVFSMKDAMDVQDKDLQEALGFNSSEDLKGYRRTLVKLGIQVIKRQRLDALNVSARTLWSRLVARTDEIYQVAEQLLPAFKSALLDLLHSVGLEERNLLLGPMKDPVRIYEKAVDDYSTGKWDLGDGVLAEAWVRDVLRCGIVAEDGQTIIKLQNLLSQSDGLRFGDLGRTSLRLLRSKNKFVEPGPTHFRYILNNMELVHGNLSMVCEVQMHHGDILLLDGTLNSHHHYDFFRAAVLKNDKEMLPEAGSPVRVWDRSRDWDVEIEKRLQAYEVSLKIISHYGSAFSVQVNDTTMNQGTSVDMLTLEAEMVDDGPKNYTDMLAWDIDDMGAA